MSKEEILSDIYNISMDGLDGYSTETALKAMDEYAEQQCIAFADWKDKNGWKIDYKEQQTHTTKELYQLFIKEQNSKV
jgi:hypothetical protein